MSTVAFIRRMLDAGFSHEDALKAAEAFEAVVYIPRSKAAIRQERYRNRLQLSEDEWNGLRSLVQERDGYACVYCGTQEDSLHVDHVVPLIQGGTNDPDNLATACRECNCGKGGRTVEEWRGAKQ
ncbi:HNH endonuclease [Rhizobium leguminosarum]|uniref:HNH endonuclease n=1 Tax=Rhizobium leguminosarum TaxID=384 RepID=UPI000B92D309|nr:HNH endonuclease [Rhizobium leguminosarum]ASS55894.1 hypothetical protein CHR56_15710 [Rhizobium leguminosarum bv. viciae]